MAGGTITRKDLITDEAIGYGPELSKNIQVAIDSQEQLIKSAKGLFEVYSQLKGVSNQKELQALQGKQLELSQKATTAYNEQTNALSRLNKEGKKTSVVWKEQDQLEKNLISTKKKNELATESTNRALIKERETLRQTNREIKSNLTEMGKLTLKRDQARKVIQEYQAKLVNGKRLSDQEQKELRQSTAEFIKYNKAVQTIKTSTGQFQENVGNYPKQLKVAIQGFRQLASAMGLVGGAFLAIKVARDVVGIVRDFGKNSATLSAILQVEREEMQGLTDDSIRLGQSTVKTAGEVTQLQIAYARLGFTQSEILDLTEATISGSIAMNSELDKTAELVGAVVNTFDDLSTTDAPKIIDIMSLATAKSALNFDKLETGIPIVAGAANAAGIPFTRLIALLGKLSDAGIDVSSSSTALRNIFIESASQGLSYEQILEKIKNSQDKLTASNDEFGKRAAVSATVLSANIDKTAELDETLQGAAGTAQRMAEKELNTLDGAIQLLNSAWEGYILNVDGSSKASTSLQNIIKFLADNLDKILNVLTFVVKGWLAYKAIMILAGVQTSLMNRRLLMTQQAAIASRNGANAATLAWSRFTKVLKANALGLAIIGITALIALVRKLNKPLNEVAENTIKTTQEFIKQKDAVNKLANENDKLVDRYEELKSKTELSKKEQSELNDIIKKLIKNVPDAVVEFDEYGNAIEISTGKIKEHNKAQKELLQQQNNKALKENKELLSELQKEQDRYNKLNKVGNSVTIQGLGTITKVNGEFKRVVSSYNGAGGSVKTYTDLKADELNKISETINKNREQIATTEDLIFSLGGEASARIKANQAIDEQNKKEAEAAEEAEAQVLIVQKLRGEISALESKLKDLTKDGYENLTQAQADEIVATREAIEQKKKELDAILGVTKAKKDEERAAKQAREDRFNLQRARLESEIKAQEEISENENEAIGQRFLANKKAFDKQLELLQLEKAFAIEEAGDRADKIKEIELKFSDDYKALVKSREDDVRGILEDSFESTLEKLKNQQELLEQSVDSRIIPIQLQLQEDLSDESLTSEERVAKIKAYEDAVKEIRRQAAFDNLNTQIEAIEKEIQARKLLLALPLSENASEEEIAKREAAVEELSALEALLSEAKIAASNQATENAIANAEKEAEAQKKLHELKTQVMQQFAQTMADSLGITEDSINNLLNGLDGLFDKAKDSTLEYLGTIQAGFQVVGEIANAVYDNNISKIDEQIEASEAYYDRQIELAQGDEDQQKALEKERERRREELEKKKRKEKEKQAKLDKAMAILQIGINTAIAIMQAYAQLGPIGGTIAAVIIGALGAVQIAAVASKPIPKYEKGTEDHPGGPAEVAEVRPEIIHEPGKKPYIQRKRAVLNLAQGTKVYPNVNEGMRKLQMAAMMTSIEMQANDLDSESTRMIFDYYGKDILDEMKENTKAVKNLKLGVNIINKNNDAKHDAYRYRNYNN